MFSRDGCEQHCLTGRVAVKVGIYLLDFTCCIRCGPDDERILDVVPREDGARNSG